MACSEMQSGNRKKVSEVQQIDHRIIKLIVGLVAVGLATSVQWLAQTNLNSISASYYYASSRDVFVGSLFVVGALFSSFTGATCAERLLTLVASALAVIVALKPCGCGPTGEAGSALHFPAAIGLFAILAYFCWAFRNRARGKLIDYPKQANRRVVMYTICFYGMVLTIALGATYFFATKRVQQFCPDFLFWVEALGLVSFGVSWLTASRIFPWFTHPNERYRWTEGKGRDDKRSQSDDSNAPPPVCSKVMLRVLALFNKAPRAR